MRRVLAAAFVGVVLLGIGAGRAQTLRIAMNNDPDLLDPTLSRTFVGTNVMTGLCDKLVDLDAKLNIVPMLATSWEYADSTTVILKLRPGVVFHDGEKMDAAAVKYSLDRHLNFPGSFRRAELSAAERVEVVDPLTVRVVLRTPASPWVASLTDRSGMMVSPKAAEASGRDFSLRPVCAGPFKFVERVAQDRIVLERFAQYWDAGRVHFDRVVYRPMIDSSVRLANLRAGAAEMADIVPTDVEQVRADPKLRLSTASSLGYQSLTINQGANPRADNPLGRDVRVRQAFALAIDRQAVVDVVYSGQFTPNAQAISAAHPLYAAGVGVPKRDVARAKALLAEAGVKLPVVVPLTIANNPQGVQVGEVLQAMVAEAGFALQPVVMDFGATLAATQKGDFVASLGGWSGLLDADSNIWSFLYSKGSLNTSGYNNPKVDGYLEAARQTSDMGKRRELYAQVWAEQGRDLPVVYLWTPRYIIGHTAKLTGFQTMPDGLMRLQGVKLEP